jgi:hypothetical protein
VKEMAKVNLRPAIQSTCVRMTAFALSIAAFVSADAAGAASDTKPKAVLRPMKITISKDTTHLTGPLRPDGWLDYARAINERSQDGVTGENNAAILFWQATGPKSIPKDKRAAFFKSLGISPLPEEGPYLIQIYEYQASANQGSAYGSTDPSKWSDEIHEQSQIAQSRPWTAKEFPVLAGWLNANAKPLKLLGAAVARSRYFEPLIVKSDGSLLDSLDIMGLSAARCAVELFRLRSMQSVAEGRIDDAWRDLLVCHRLARLLARKAFLVDGLVARSLEQRACDGDVALVHHAHQPSERLAQLQRELLHLPNLPSAERFLFGERLFCLDWLRRVAAGDSAALNLSIGLLHEDLAKNAREKLLADRRIDWEVVFRTFNSRFDEVENAWHEPSLLRRRQALKLIDETTRTAANRVNDPAVLAAFLSPKTASSDLSRQLAEILLDSSDYGYAGYAAGQAMTMAKSQLTTFAFALARYHNDHSAYPRDLAELSPEYVSEVPKDPCSDRDYIYRQRDNGYLLYSVGRNGRDDRGQSWMDNPKKYEGQADFDKLPDDICIRSPEVKY